MFNPWEEYPDDEDDSYEDDRGDNLYHERVDYALTEGRHED